MMADLCAGKMEKWFKKQMAVLHNNYNVPNMDSPICYWAMELPTPTIREVLAAFSDNWKIPMVPEELIQEVYTEMRIPPPPRVPQPVREEDEDD
jgi:hypothetical protein